MPDIPDPLLLEENHPSNTSIAETDLDDDELIGKSTVSLPSFIMNQFYRHGLILFNFSLVLLNKLDYSFQEILSIVFV